MYQIRRPTPLASSTTMAAAPLIAITYRKEARVLQYEGRLYADLGRFYLGGTPAARADWAARRAWTTQRAGVGDGDDENDDDDEAASPPRVLADAVARLYRDARAPEAEPGARGDRACGLAIQEARRRYGRELSRDDVRLMRDLGCSLAEMVAYLAQFDDDDDDDDAAAAGPRFKVYSDAELEEQGYDIRALGGTPTTATGYSPTPTASEPRTVPRSGGAATMTTTTAWAPAEGSEEKAEQEEEEEEAGQEEEQENEEGMPAHHHHHHHDGAGRQFDLPAAYRHLVSPLDSHDAADADDDADPFVDGGGGRRRAVTAAALVRVLRAPAASAPRPPGAPYLPMPTADAAAWQKEAVAVCRLLLPRVARRLETVRRQLAILERPPPSLSSSSSSSRARFRRRERSRGSPYKSSPLASG